MASPLRPDAGRLPSGRRTCRGRRRTVALPVRPGQHAPVEVDEPTSDTDVTPDRPWIVIVWNDPINLMSYVVFVFQKLFGYSQGEGHRRSCSTCTTRAGRWCRTAPREKAELDVFRLHEHGLWATMQHDE